MPGVGLGGCGTFGVHITRSRLNPHRRFGIRFEFGHHDFEAADHVARIWSDVKIKSHLPKDAADRVRIARNAFHQRAAE